MTPSLAHALAASGVDEHATCIKEAPHEQDEQVESPPGKSDGQNRKQQP